MKHRKKEHERIVPKCKKEQNESCRYGPTFSWFKHTDDKSENESFTMNQNDDTRDIIKKLFDMMENFAKRLVEIEGLK